MSSQVFFDDCPKCGTETLHFYDTERMGNPRGSMHPANDVDRLVMICEDCGLSEFASA